MLLGIVGSIAGQGLLDFVGKNEIFGYPFRGIVELSAFVALAIIVYVSSKTIRELEAAM